MNDLINNSRLLVSVSGGKDSTAMCLHLFELGYTKADFDRVFMDTGWEHENTYKYLDELEQTIGKITRIKASIAVKEEDADQVAKFEEMLGFESPFVRRIFKYKSFPTRLRKWCTSDLKMKPVSDYINSLDYDVLNLVGIRRQESQKRSTYPEFEFNEKMDCWTWRPLIDWSEKDVIEIHHRFNLIPNQLYLNGSNRVGCYPCINSRKQEIKNLDDKRIAIIRELEQTIASLKGVEFATFFHSKLRSKSFMPIDECVAWSKTARGGVQFEMFDSATPTCEKWGLCHV